MSQPGALPEIRDAPRLFGGAGSSMGARAIKAANLGRERWVYGLHALTGLLLGMPSLGLIADWLMGAPEAHFLLLVAMLGMVIWPLLLFLAVGWVVLSGYWLWTGDARRRSFLLAWYAGAALSLLVMFWPVASINAFVIGGSLAGVLITTLVLPLRYWR
jgi:hypothetical protein